MADSGEKRRVSELIPFYRENGTIFIFFQKRSADAPRMPGMFGFFGGGAEENESPEETLVREISEELGITLNANEYDFFGKYEFHTWIAFIFFMKVSKEFADRVTIFEGECGVWFSEDDIVREEKFIDEDRIMLKDFFQHIRSDNSHTTEISDD